MEDRPLTCRSRNVLEKQENKLTFLSSRDGPPIFFFPPPARCLLCFPWDRSDDKSNTVLTARHTERVFGDNAASLEQLLRVGLVRLSVQPHLAVHFNLEHPCLLPPAYSESPVATRTLNSPSGWAFRTSPRLRMRSARQRFTNPLLKVKRIGDLGGRVDHKRPLVVGKNRLSGRWLARLLLLRRMILLDDRYQSLPRSWQWKYSPRAHPAVRAFKVEPAQAMSSGSVMRTHL